jgi:hypothetical protein
MTIRIHPYIRLYFLIGTLISIILFHQVKHQLLLYGALILPLVIFTSNVKIHLRLLLFGILPISLTFILIYIIILIGSNGSWDFICLKILKILNITSIFQIALTIKPGEMLSTFKKVGIKGEKLITLMGTFSVWTDIKRRSEQIVVARFARGFIGKRNFINTAKQLPYVLVPLIIGILRTSVERSQAWIQWDVVALINNRESKKYEYSIVANLIIGLLTTLFIVFGILID